MARHRLLNCEFVNASSFKVNVSNRAKLLYLMMFTNGDDRGFVDTTQDLIDALEKNDSEVDRNVSLELIANTYNTALQELIEKGYLYEFKDNHNNKVHLIRHWFYHNRLVKGLWTNYKNFLEMVYLENNEYFLGKKPLKENKVNETKVKETTINEDIVEEKPPKKEEHIMTMFEFLDKCGVKRFDDLTPEQKEEWEKYIDSIDLDESDLPF